MLALQLTVLFTSIWVFLDSGKLGFKKDPSSKSFTNMGPIGWALGSLVLWIVVFPLYLFERKKRAASPDAKGLPLLSLGVAVIVAILVGNLGSSKSLEEAAKPVVTQLLHENFHSEVECIRVKIKESPAKGFHKATALLQNGNELEITITEKEDGKIYVMIPNR
jgi:hypothetical protein